MTELKGSMASLTDEEDRELKRTNLRLTGDGGGVRRDFSVIHSKQKGKNHLFLGPARFVNVSLCCSHFWFCVVDDDIYFSMTVIIIASCFARVGILRFESCGLSPLERRLLHIMGMDTVRSFNIQLARHVIVRT